MADTALDLSAHSARNRDVWDRRAAEDQRKHGARLAELSGAAWRVWQIHGLGLRVLGEVGGRDVLELGCGAAQWSIALHRLGARVTGLDNSAGQLVHARVLMEAPAADFPLVHASGEATGLADESFDIVFCDHGAMTFGDPYRTVPKAGRLLHPAYSPFRCTHLLSILPGLRELTTPASAWRVTTGISTRSMSAVAFQLL